ncbi:hypothetical protein D3C71_1010130 [compost metagenome]
MKHVGLLAACSVILVSCDQPSKPSASVEAPHVEAPTLAAESAPVEPLSIDQLTALAFRAAWGAPPPIERNETTDGQTEHRTYRSGKLIPLDGDRFAFISEGHGGEAHVSAGALAIHYLKRTGDGFERVGSWPAFLVSGTWGSPPEWKIRTDLTPSPTVIAEGGGTWQGYTCSWAHVIELTPQRPVIRIDQIGMSYSDGGARVDGSSKSMEGVLIPGQKGKTMRVRYTGDVDETVTYAKVGEVYDPVNLPDLPSC